MIAIEKHLTDHGYTRYRYDFLLKKLVEEIKWMQFSSLGNLYYSYIKEGHKPINIGLCIYGIPPSIITPVFIEVLKVLKNGNWAVCELENPQIGMGIYSIDEIIKAIDNGKPLFIHNGKRLNEANNSISENSQTKA